MTDAPLCATSPHGDALAYRHRPGTGATTVFLPGYMSDMRGAKAVALDAWAARRGRAYLRLDYSGCGESGGAFDDGSIGRWTADVHAVLDAAGVRRAVLVGSSMGGWIALRAALAWPDLVAGLVLVAAAPDFVDWGLVLTGDDRAALARDGFVERPSAYADTPYRYARALVDDAAAQSVLGGEIAFDGPVRLLHGQCDDAVPWALSLDVAARLRSRHVQVTLVKDGDHRLSRPADLRLLEGALDALHEDLA